MIRALFALILLGLNQSVAAQFNFEWVSHPTNLVYDGGDIDGGLMTTDEDGNTYMIGVVNNVADVDLSAASSYVFAQFGPTNYFVKYGPSGNLIWKKTFGFLDCNKLIVNNAGDLLLVGAYNASSDLDPSANVVNMPAFGGSDIFVAKYDTAGNYILSFGVGGNLNDIANGVDVDDFDNIYVTGQFENTVDFDPSVAVANQVASNGDDIFVGCYSTTGAYQWAFGIGGANDDSGVEIDVHGGNIYLTGMFEDDLDFDPSPAIHLVSANQNKDIFIAQYDLTGIFQWAYGIGANSEFVNDMIVTPAGDLIIAGIFSNTLDFDPSIGTFNLTPYGNKDGFIAKYDVNGGFLWAKRIGGTNADDIVDLAFDGANNFYMIGTFSGSANLDPALIAPSVSSVGMRDVFTSKYDLDGNYVWGYGFGNNNDDLAVEISVSPLGSVVFAMEFENTIDFDQSAGVDNHTSGNGYVNVALASYTANGLYNWAGVQGALDQTGPEGREIGYDLAFGQNGEVYVVGEYGSEIDFDGDGPLPSLPNAGQKDFFIGKYNSAGDCEWSLGLGGASEDVGTSIATDAVGNIYVTGHILGSVDFDPSPGVAILSPSPFSSVSFVAKYDSQGNYIWAFTTEGIAYANSIAIDGQGKVFVSGTFFNTVDFDPSSAVNQRTSAGSADIFIACYDSNGAFLSVDGFGGSGSDNPNDLALDDDDNVYIVGYSSSQIDFDPSPNSAIFTSLGSRDGFIVKYNNTIDFVWMDRIGGSQDNRAHAVAVDANGSVYTTGFYTGSCNFGLNSGISYVSNGSFDAFVTKHDSAGVVQWVNHFGGSSFDQGKSIDVDTNGNSYILGSSHGVVNFNENGTPWTLGGSYFIFLTSFNSQGEFIYAGSTGIIGSDDGNSVLINDQNDIFITGYYSEYEDFDFGAGEYNIASYNPRDAYVAKYSQLCIPYSEVITVSSCVDYTWSINSTSYNTSGVYAEYMTGVNGCDSTIFLDLTILQPDSSNVQNVTECNSYNWPQNGMTYLSSGSYYENLVASNGCDSVISLHLSLLSSTVDTSVVIACGNYTWPINGVNYTNSTYVTETYNNTSGCASSATLDLTIVNVDATVNSLPTTLTANASGASYQWVDCGTGNSAIVGANGQSFTPTYNGSFAVEVTQNGCTETSICYEFQNVGIEENESNSTLLIPNPASTQIEIILDAPDAFDYTIYTTDGKLIQEGTNYYGTIDVSNLKNGMYLIRIENNRVDQLMRFVVFRK